MRILQRLLRPPPVKEDWQTIGSDGRTTIEVDVTSAKNDGNGFVLAQRITYIPTGHIGYQMLELNCFGSYKITATITGSDAEWVPLRDAPPILRALEIKVCGGGR